MIHKDYTQGLYTKSYNKHESYTYVTVTITREKTQNKQLLTHWIIPLINTPKVLYNRFLQVSGTCTLNAILHSLLFAEGLRYAIKYQVDKKCKNQKDLKCNFTYDKFRDDTVIQNIEDLLFSLLKNYFDGVRPHTTKQFDMIIYLAAMLKSKYQKKIDDTNSSDLSLDEFDMNQRYPEEHKYKLCKSSDDNNLRKIVCDDTNPNRLNKLNEKCSYKSKYKDSSICNMFHEKSDESKGFIYGNIMNTYMVLYILEIIFGIEFKFNKEYELKTSETGNVKFIISSSNYSGELKLCTSLLLVRNGEHAITGIKINDQYITFDSHNKWDYIEWHKWDFYSTGSLTDSKYYEIYTN